MKPFVLKHVRCPLDGGDLNLVVFKQNPVSLTPSDRQKLKSLGLNEADFNVEILHGTFLNDRLKIMYPIFRGVPRLLVFLHKLIPIFELEFVDQINKLKNSGYRFPNDLSIPGEINVLSSFSEEWTSYGYNEEVYWGQKTEVYNASLKTTLRPNVDLTGKLVLEVGIGSGGSANFLCKEFNSISFGVDLGYSVDVAFSNFSANPFLHMVQASVFNLPFSKQAFDFVYSHGVIHHTFSTRLAFDKLAAVTAAGGKTYVWVYSHLNESRTLKRKFIMLLEQLIRPWCSRLPDWLQTLVLLPIAPLYIMHQNTIQQNDKKGMAKYKWREAMHAARDRFTPRYIHRHSEEEVMKWFADAGYREIVPLSAKQLPDFVPEGFYMNTGVEGLKS